ncbi:MAG TPA: alpha-hydroxy-acid oxidizing protein [Thermodesulfobacteriota bacterium]|nr:alpha-hydroxy-acid oxidizing protein [Thermodesulfobacteriota bacterium]
MDMKEIRRIAREKFNGACRVCPVCNGRACAGEMPGIGGVGTGSSFIANFESLARIKVILSTIHDASDPDLSYDFFGLKLKMPILVAPLAGMIINMGRAMEEREYLAAMVAGGKDAGTISCTCDGPNPMFFDLGMEILKENGGWGVPTLKPRPEKDFLALARRAEDCGVKVIATDIDAAGIIHLRRAGQPAGPWPVEAWKKTLSQTRLPVIFKGVMTVRDAEMAVEAGAAGIVVSNHGGRVLDHTPGTAEVLPEIASAVKGKIKILVDGGIRSGVDVLKMLALGAEAVLIGRPLAIAAVGGGKEGVALLLNQYADELRTAMVYSGSKSVSEVSASALHHAGKREK